VSEQPHEIVVETGVKVPMRDGTLLDAMIWRPAAPCQYPVLVERVAYELAWRATANGEYYARHGYVVVAQNVRGTFASEGSFASLRDDGWGTNQDGYDTVEWAAAQPWSSGQVGMLDGSYSGSTQYAAAPTRPPHLRALFVRQAIADARDDTAFPGGAHRLMATRTAIVHGFVRPQLGKRPGILSAPETRLRVEQAIAAFDRELWQLPLKSWPLAAGIAESYRQLLDHPDDGPHWAGYSLSQVVSEVDTPILHLTSWYDFLANGVIRAFTGIRAHGRTAACREAQRLIVGPWIHGADNVGQCQVGEIDYGPDAAFDLHGWRLRWYDHWLKGAETGIMDGPPVRIFLMGTNRWLGLQEWPPADVTYRPFHLAGGTEADRGRLTFAALPADDPPDSFRYDPDNPVPSMVVKAEVGPIDRRSIEDRVLVYTSEVLTEDLHVVGPLTAVLYASSSAPDTDWVVRLCDVWPDGRSIFISDGILRARYRDSQTDPSLLEPGRVYRFTVAMRPTAQTFQAGHRLRVHVTSSDFPRYDRNLNTGGPFGEEASGQDAINTVCHDALRPSHLLLPVFALDVDHVIQM
jgi:putative CocE/NonD family hydrolase